MVFYSSRELLGVRTVRSNGVVCMALSYPCLNIFFCSPLELPNKQQQLLPYSVPYHTLLGFACLFQYLGLQQHC